MLRLVDPAVVGDRDRLHGRAVRVRDVGLLIVRHLARAEESVVAVTGAGHQRAVRVDRDRLRGVVGAGVERRQVVALGVGRVVVRVAQAHLDAEVRRDAPTVGHERLDLPEAEEADRVELRLAVGAEVAEQRVGEGVAGAARVARGVEAHVAGVLRAAVLLLGVVDAEHAGLDRVRALQDRQGIGEGEVLGRRDQGGAGAVPAGEPADPADGNGVLVRAPVRVDLRELEAVRRTRPRVPDGVDRLVVAGVVELDLVQQRVADRPVVAHLEVPAGPVAVRRHRRQVAVDKRAVRRGERVVVEHHARGQPVGGVDVVVEPHHLLAPAERVRHLEERVAGGGRVRVGARDLRHLRIEVAEGHPVGRDPVRRDDVAGKGLAGGRVPERRGQVAEVSPRIAVVGRVCSEGLEKRSICFHSTPAKKKSLSLTIGPPRAPPKSLYLRSDRGTLRELEK